MRKNSKKLFVLCIALIIILINSNVYAGQTEFGGAADTLPTPTKKSGFSDIINDAYNFTHGKSSEYDKDKDIVDKPSIEPDKLIESSNNISGYLFIIGVALSTIVGGILGVKFMFASNDEKADIKQSMIPYIVGCAVIFGASAIWKIAVVVLDQLNRGSA